MSTRPGAAAGIATEREFKFRSPVAVRREAVTEAVAELGLALGAGTSLSHVDLYLDDDRHRLAAAGRALRLRRETDRGVLACKERGPIDGALHVRTEIEAPWEGTEPPDSVAVLPQALRDATEPFVEDRPLRPFVALAVERERLDLVRGNELLGEIALDRVVADLRGRTCTFFELELEVHRDLAECARVAEHLADALPLDPAADDKLAHALALLFANPQPTRQIERSASPLDGIQDAISRATAALLQAESHVRVHGDDESVHELRTASRRLRTWLRAIRSHVPPEVFAPTKLDAVELHRAGANARTFAVLHDHLSGESADLPDELAAAMPSLRKELGDRRDAAIAELATRLRSEAHRAVRTRLAELPARLVLSPGDAPSADRVVRRLQRRAGRRLRDLLRTLDRDAGWQSLHDIRLAAKSLRILTDEPPFEVRLPPPTRRRLLACLHRLGRLGDARDARERWLALAQAPGSPPDALRAALLGALAARSHAREPALRRRALRALRRLDRPRHWRAFDLRG